MLFYKEKFAINPILVVAHQFRKELASAKFEERVFPNVCPYVESVNVHDQPRKAEHFIEPTSPCLVPPK